MSNLHPATRRLASSALLAVLVTTAGGSASAAPEPGWRSPLRPLVVRAAFDPPAHDWMPGHRGVDLDADPGQSVRAAGAGRVTFAAELAGRGVVVVDHGEVRTTYQPVAATAQVGEHVRAGEVIGAIAEGAGHCGDGECLHLGLRRGDIYLDPMLILAGAQAVLRPW